MNIRQILPALAGIAVLCGPVRADIAPYLPPPHDFRRPIKSNSSSAARPSGRPISSAAVP